MRQRAIDAAAEDFAERFAGRFRERAASPRKVGREAEFPLVDAAGRAGDCARLWQSLIEATGGRPVHDQPGPDGSRLLIGVETERWFCLAEVGLGTVEIGVGPRSSLFELEADLRTALGAVVPVAERLGYRLLGYGIQPRTPPHPGLMTPKRRYLALLEAIGPRWLRWAVTASDQVHVDVARGELVDAINVVNACAGALIALAANSPVYGGRVGGFASGREGLSADVTREPYRNGSVPRAFADLEDYVRFTFGYRCLALPDGRGGFRLPDGTFADEVAGGRVGFDDFLFHEHYLWPSGRPRARLGTLEVRPACQQPGASFVAAALSVGLVEAHRDVAGFLGDLQDPVTWEGLLAFRRRAVRDGIRAREPRPGFLETLLDLAEAGLRRRGLGEEGLLGPLRERLARRAGPADLAREITGRGGAASLARELALQADGAA